MIETIDMDTTVKAKDMIDHHINLEQGMIREAMTQGKGMTMVTRVEKENEMIILIQFIMDQGNNSTGESRFSGAELPFLRHTFLSTIDKCFGAVGMR